MSGRGARRTVCKATHLQSTDIGAAAFNRVQSRFAFLPLKNRSQCLSAPNRHSERDRDDRLLHAAYARLLWVPEQVGFWTDGLAV
jgi:hypothetical protein